MSSILDLLWPDGGEGSALWRCFTQDYGVVLPTLCVTALEHSCVTIRS